MAKLSLSELIVIHENDSDHADALNKTGYWGRIGAGALILAQDTGRILFPLRSQYVEQPLTYGTWGGAIDSSENVQEALVREITEEMGNIHIVQTVPLFVFKDKSFRYYNFLVIVEKEFSPTLNWETKKAVWVNFGEWPQPLHFGVKSLLSDSASYNKIKMLSKKYNKGRT